MKSVKIAVSAILGFWIVIGAMELIMATMRGWYVRKMNSSLKVMYHKVWIVKIFAIFMVILTNVIIVLFSVSKLKQKEKLYTG
jgi:hypothetical protein